MKMAGQMGLLIATIMMLTFLEGSNAAEYVVGGDFGWNTSPNASFYEEWASSKTFQIGDIVMFDTRNVSMGELRTLAEYRNCTKPGLFYLDVQVSYTLTSNGSRFFVSTFTRHSNGSWPSIMGEDEQCKRGTKVMITVGSPTTVAPNRASSLSSLSFGAMVATTLCTFLFALFNQ